MTIHPGNKRLSRNRGRRRSPAQRRLRSLRLEQLQPRQLLSVDLSEPLGAPMDTELGDQYICRYSESADKADAPDSTKAQCGVFEPDDREFIADTASFPWSAVGWINSDSGRGSGFMVSPYHFLTAGHVVHDGSGAEWSTKANTEIYLGMRESHRPFGVAGVVRQRSYTGWTENGNESHDWALLTLDRSVGDYSGYFPGCISMLSDGDYKDLKVNLAGYPGSVDANPGDENGEQMWWAGGQLDSADEHELYFNDTLDATAGMSGGPVWHVSGGDPYIVGIIAYCASDYNWATRMTFGKIDDLYDWIDVDNDELRPADEPDLIDLDELTDLAGTSNARASFSQDTITPGESFTATAQIYNSGTDPADDFTVRFFATTDPSDPAATQYDVGEVTVTESVQPYESTEVRLSGTFPNVSSGYSWYLGWDIDSDGDVAEIDEDNNIGYLYSPFTVLEAVDLRGSYFNVTPEPLTVGDDFNVDFAIRNDEPGYSDSFDVKFWLSRDDSVQWWEDVSLGSYRVAGVAGNDTTGTMSTTLSLPADDDFWAADGDGTYYICMVVDSQTEVIEVNESNNCGNGLLKDYDGVEIDTLPDLEPMGFNVVEESVEAGDVLNVTCGLINSGADSAGAFDVGFYLSTDDDVQRSDRLLGTSYVSGLGVGVAALLYPSLTLPGRADPFWYGDGDYYLGMIIDPDNGVPEANESNNRSQGHSVDFDAIEITNTLGSIRGVTYHDCNANGIWQPALGESGLEDWIVYLDENGNDRFDLGATLDPDDYDLGASLRHVLPEATLTAVGSGITTGDVTAAFSLYAATGVTALGNDYGTWQEGVAELWISLEVGVSTVSIDFVSDALLLAHDVGRLVAYDRQANVVDTYTTAGLSFLGSETMTVSSSSRNIVSLRAFGLGSHAGHLDNLVIGTGSGELFGVTDSTGHYVIEQVPNGDHTAREVRQRTWQQTAPAGDERQLTVDIAHPDVAGIHFGNVQPAEINGVKWHDLNGNGNFDTGEPGLEGWTIYLDLDEDGQFDPDEPSTVTNEDGVYGFRGLGPGTYTVAEVPQPQWEQTYPGDLYYLYDQDFLTPHVMTVSLGSYITDLAVTGPPLGGIAYDSHRDVLYGIGHFAPELYELDQSTGAPMNLGAIGAGGGNGLAYNPLDGFLYTVNTSGQLVQINPMGPASTVVSGTGPGVGANAMAYNPDDERIYVYQEGASGTMVYSYDATTFAGPEYHTTATAISGILGMTHNGQTLVLSQGPPTDQNIYSYDPDTGDTEPLLDTDLLDTRDVAAMTYVASDGTHTVSVDYGDRVGMVDFGNWRTVGDVHGAKWEDLDADGIRDGRFPTGDDADVVLVIDVSDSVDTVLNAADVGDVNGDGTANTIIDVELAALIALNDVISETATDVGVVIFGNYGVQMDMDESTGGTQLTTTPAADNDGNGVSDVEDVLLSIREGGYVGGLGTAGIGTDYGEALQAAIDTFSALGTPSGYGTLIFVSDGQPVLVTGYEDEVKDLEDMGIDVRAFGIGNEIVLTHLQNIDEDAVYFTDSDEILTYGGLAREVLEFTEPGLPDWTIFLDMDGNGELDEETGTVDSGNVSLPISDSDVVTDSLPVGELGGLITDVNLTLHVGGLSPATFNPLAVSLVSPAGTRVELSRTVTDGELEVALPDDFDGELPNGDWTLEVSGALGSGVSGGSLESWTLSIESAEPIATTDADGNYSLTDLPPATYEVTEVIPSNWTQTFPGPPDLTHTIELHRADVFEGVDFGNVPVTPVVSVVGRHVFYNNSAFDGNDPAPNANDNAIAPDKTVLMPGHTATLANYTNHSGGVNGIMVDVRDAAAPGQIAAEDFVFKVGNADDPAGWRHLATQPGVTVQPGAGVDGSDRITLVWDDHVIQNQWLQVTLLANDRTGLAEDDLFYFGNAIGESGNSASDARVNALDALLARNNPRTLLNPAPIDFPYDFNHDQRVNATDMLIARSHQTHLLSALKLISLPPRSAHDVALEENRAMELADPDGVLAKTGCVDGFGQISEPPQSSRKIKPEPSAVDLLLSSL